MEFNYAITLVVIASYRTVTNCSASLQFRWTLPKKTRLGAHWSEHHCCVEGWLSLRRTTLGRNLRPAKFYGQGQMTRSSDKVKWRDIQLEFGLYCLVFQLLTILPMFLIRWVLGRSLLATTFCWDHWLCRMSVNCSEQITSYSIPRLQVGSRATEERCRNNIHGSRWPRTTLREFSHLCWYFKIEKTFFSKCLLQIVAVCQLGSVDSWIIWYWKCFWIVH